MSDAVVKRLEAVAAKLEAYAAGLGSSSSSSSSTASAATGSSSSGPSARLQAYDAFVSASVQPFLDAANSVEGTKPIAKHAASGLTLVRSLVAATDSCKKPSDADLAKFLTPLGSIIEAGSNPDNRSPTFNQAKAWAEGQAGLLLWPQISPATAGTTPKQFVQDMLEAADFYLNKVLVDAKKSGDEQVGKFATTFKACMQALQQFIAAHFAAGLEWNPKGGDLSAFSASSSASAVPTAPDAPPAPPAAPAAPPAPSAPGAPGAPGSFAPAKPTTSGMGAVFGELNSKGEGVTSGLRKVTSDMKTKNRKDEPALEVKAPSSSAASAPKKAAPVAAKKPPATYLSKGTWFVEHHEGAHDIVLNEVQIKENVYILKCNNATIHIPSKCKSVQVDNCVKTRIVFHSVVSVFEIFNSQRVAIECQEVVPSVSVDKSAGVSVELSRAAVATPPTIITSSITEMNIVVPGATDEDDPIEIPMPEQYETKLLPGQNKLVTEAVAHSAN